jgi:ribose transport system ATP-binding protein
VARRRPARGLKMRLAIEAVGKVFPSVRALDDVSLDIFPGEIHALMGENGAGKSTLIKIITGVYKPDAGGLRVDGQPQSFASPRDALAAGIGAVHQERNLIPRFSVGENILLEHPPTRRGLVDFAAVNRQARPFLEMLGARISPETEVARLSVAQMQLVEVAKALSLNARLLLLDEPTASITSHEAAALFAILRQLRTKGVAIVFVSHKLEEVFAIADRVTVLRDGHVAASGELIGELTRGHLVSLMIGRDEQIIHLAGRSVERSEAAVLELESIATSFGHRDIDLALHRGEILGLYGLVGAGRTELGRAILGAGAILAGEIRVRGKSVRIRDVNEALTRYRIGYVSDNRKEDGLILVHSVRRNVAITLWRRIANAVGLIAEARERNAVAPVIERLSVRAASLDEPVALLSGGNQQKVSIAKWLAATTEILIIDEPTVGIDIKTKAQLHELIDQITRDGVSVLLISSDMPEMIALADRIMILHGFRVVGEIGNDHDYEGMSNAIMSCIHSISQQSGLGGGAP